MDNQLQSETSPYLLQHADNPVHWRAWNDAALAEARAADKPILLSIGYSACHWCHVMAHESFEDEATARLMNELFVNIKLDREERPDIDKIYQLAHQLMNGRGGGWPLTVFLNPHDQVPIFIGTYFPREPRYGMPGFKDVLVNVARYFQENDEAVRSTGKALRSALGSLTPNARQEPLSPLGPEAIALARRNLAEAFDADHGGFGTAPKFPHPTNLEFLLDAWRHSAEHRRPDLEALRMTALTLTRMAEQGLYDQLGGGFFRYCVDQFWLIPHFEKMLYDNAALLALYSQAYAATGEALFGRIAAETAAWAGRDMRQADGAFFATLDADSEGQEGRFYVWTREELAELLDDMEQRVLSRYYGMDAAPNFEERHWHLHCAEPLASVAHAEGLDEPEAARILARGREKLLRRRNERVWPHRDEKVLTAWNGLMIKGLAIAARALQRPDLADDATTAVDAIGRRLWQNGRLYASYKDERARFPAYLDDYAFMADALLELLQCRWRTQDLRRAVELIEVMLAHFEDPNGGFFFTADDHETLLHRPKPYQDEALPSGNGIAAQVLICLGHLLGEARFLEAANRLLLNAWPVLQRYPEAHGSLIKALRGQLEPPTLIVIRGERAELEAWHRYVNAGYNPQRLAFCIPNDVEDLPGQLAGFTPRTSTVAYVCRGTHCEAPIGSLEDLLARLGRASGHPEPGAADQ
jgi:uncharacterized protein YyaL (SSP411 family)